MLKKKKAKDITIIMDDREKKPWGQDYLGKGFKVVRQRLQTGDYTIKGLEDVVCIEKKSGWQEIALDVAKKDNRERFIKCLRRMREFPVRILVIHSDIPKIMTTPQYSSAVNPQVLFNWAVNIQVEYGVMLMPVGARTKSKYIVREMFRKIVEYNKTGRLYHAGA